MSATTRTARMIARVSDDAAAFADEFRRLVGYAGKTVRVTGFAGCRTERIVEVDMVGEPRSWAIVREREDGSRSVLSPRQVGWLYGGFNLQIIGD